MYTVTIVKQLSFYSKYFMIKLPCVHSDYSETVVILFSKYFMIKLPFVCNDYSEIAVIL